MERKTTCSKCGEEPTLYFRQLPLCEEHAKEKLNELQTEFEKVREEFEKLQGEYETLLDEYDVESYGQLEHEVNVEGREDVGEEEVKQLGSIENDIVAKRQRVQTLEHDISSLEEGLENE